MANSAYPDTAGRPRDPSSPTRNESPSEPRNSETRRMIDTPTRKEALVFGGEEAEVKADTTLFRRHKRLCTCCGITVALLVILVIIIVILAFTLFKTKQPKFTFNKVTFENIDFALTTRSASANITVDLDISVRNPNRASFKYTNGTAFVYYHGEDIAEVAIPAGKVGARKTVRIETTTKVFADRLVSSNSLLSDLTTGDFPLSVQADLSGRVNILNIVKKHVRASTECSLVYVLQSQSMANMTCKYHVHL